jgi:Tfp pilus assembly protein PilX
MTEERIRQLEREKGFWKRLALLALTVLVLVLLGSASLSGTLYFSLVAEKERFAQHERQQIEAAERALREAEQLLRQGGRGDAEREFREAVQGLKQPNQGDKNNKRD